MLHKDALQSVPFELPLNAPGPDPRDGVDLETIIRFWRKRRRLFLFWLAAGVLAGIAYAVVAPGYYTASASLLLEDNAARAAVPAAGATDAAHSTYVETQIQVFASDEVIARVVDAKNLTEDAEFGGRSGGLRALLVGYARTLLGSKVPPPEPRYATILRVRHGLLVRRVGTSDVVELMFTSRNAARSADFANAMIQSYIDGRVALQRSERAETEAHVRQVLAELRDKAFPGAAAAAEGASQAPQGAPPGGEADSPPDTGSRARARFLEQQDRTETYRALYGRLLQRALGDTDAQLVAKNVRVISPATPPLIPSSRLIVVVVLSVVGGVVGLSHALLWEVTDDTLRSAEELRRATGFDQVAEIPKLHSNELRGDKPSHAPASYKASHKGAGHEGADHGKLQPVYTAVPAAAYEAIARLAVVLHDGGNHRGGWVIGVAPLTPGAGASLVAAQFARVIAETGRKVLVVDANWRKRPAGPVMLSTSQGRSLARGMGSIPLGDAASDEGSLDVLTLRAAAPLSELNASLSIVSTIELLRGEHDCVVVDLHACDETADLDAALVAVDQVILVAAARRTAARSLNRVMRKIPGRKLAAVVLNRV